MWSNRDRVKNFVMFDVLCLDEKSKMSPVCTCCAISPTHAGSLACRRGVFEASRAVHGMQADDMRRPRPHSHAVSVDDQKGFCVARDAIINQMSGRVSVCVDRGSGADAR